MMKKTFTTQKTNNFFYNNYSIVEREIDFSNTVTFTHLVDLTAVEQTRSRYPEGHRPTYTAFVAKALAEAMQDFKYSNRRFYRPFGFFSRRFQIFNTVDIAIASEVDMPGLEYVAFIDILRNVESQSLDHVAAWLKEFRTEQNQNKQWKTFSSLIINLPNFVAKMLIRLPIYFPAMWTKYRGGAAMISSPAKYGVDGVVAAWTAPIGVSFGLVKHRALVIGGKVVAAPSFYLTLNFDRRLMAGAQAAKFFSRFVASLESGSFQHVDSALDEDTETLRVTSANISI